MEDFYPYVDKGVKVLEPSPQRVRNILTLEERVRAIQAYDQRPMYTKVAKMFNCSWEQIKNIIANRESILEFYEATRNTHKDPDPDREEIRKRKLVFLGECMYEYIQRAQFYLRADLNEEILRTKALEFRDLIQIDKFVPNKPWINHFKAAYNISLSNRQITLTRRPPDSMDLKDIMTYCSKNKTHNNKLFVVPAAQLAQQSPKPLYRTKTRAEISLENQATLEVMENRRKRKLNFLERALYEYVQRATFHQKVPPNPDRLRDIAISLRDILKIDNFFPDKNWIKHFKNRFNFNISQGVSVTDRTPPLSMDLRDILSFCSRNDKEQPPATVTLAPKENTIATLRSNARAAKANVSKPEQMNKTVQPPVTSAKVESSQQYDEDDDDDVVAVEVKHELIEIKDDDDDEYDKDDKDCQPPPLKIKKIESLTELNEKPAQSPGHWSEHSGEDDAELPKSVRNYKDALRLLKPLEEFAMLEENYRVIGLVSQLEEIFKNPPKKNDEEEECDY